MRNSVLFLVLLAGMCIPILEVAGWIGQSGGGSNSGCHSDNDCHFHHCGTGQTPHCSHGTCSCRDSGCHSDSDCHSHHCGTGQTPHCSSHGSCYCNATNATTTTTYTTTPITTSPSTTLNETSGVGQHQGGSINIHYSGCHSDSDCHSHHCATGQTPYCHNGGCHCRGCHSDSDCHSHHCGIGQMPHCSSHLFSQGRCYCRDSGCHSDSDCHSHLCGIGQTPHCASSGNCHCRNTGCHSDLGCHSYLCRTGQTPHCSDGNCDCRSITYSGCHSDSACHSHPCGTGQTPYCHNGGCYCRDSGCHFDSDCHSHPCGTGQTPYCNNGGCHCRGCHSDSDCHSYHCDAVNKPFCHNGGCHCRETTTTTTTTTEAPTTTPESTTVDPQLLMKCRTHIECISHVCPAGKHPYCSFGQRSTNCQCTVCTDDSHCFCPAGLVGKCHFNYFDRSYSCVCGFAPEPTAVNPLSSITCLYHSDCNRHVCQAGHHPYCKFDQHSSKCQCTVCTNDSHCICPIGLVGKCHFDLSLLKYSCTCDHLTATTTPVLTTKTTTTTATHQASGKPCPFCDTDLNCVWNQTCSDSETCMVRAVLEQGFKFSVHCIMSSDCQLMTTKFGEIYCCDDRSCLEHYLYGE